MSAALDKAAAEFERNFLPFYEPEFVDENAAHEAAAAVVNAYLDALDPEEIAVPVNTVRGVLSPQVIAALLSAIRPAPQEGPQ